MQTQTGCHWSATATGKLSIVTLRKELHPKFQVEVENNKLQSLKTLIKKAG